MSKVISVRSTAVTERQSPVSTAMEFVLHDIRHEERQEGEWSEIVDPEPFSKGTTGPSPLSLNKLLTTGPENTAHSKELTELEVETLKENLSTSHKHIEHLTKLSGENEATVMRLEEQAKILKEEIRRLERNQQREKEVVNMEYLKNIFLKEPTTLPINHNNSSSKEGSGGLIFTAGQDWCERQGGGVLFSPLVRTGVRDKEGVEVLYSPLVWTGVRDKKGVGTHLHRWSGLV